VPEAVILVNTRHTNPAKTDAQRRLIHINVLMSNSGAKI
jgi:hypothetical protein